MQGNRQQSGHSQLVISYEQGLEGTLLSMQESAETRYEYEIWFDYTRQAMNKIREGALLAVENFASTSNERRYSLLEVISILPMHYALGERPEGYPGFVVEAARSAARDWIDQEHEAIEDITKIRCIAIPTNLEIREHASASELSDESNLPMVGAKVRVLDTSSTEAVLNRGILHQQPLFEVGRLIRDSQVRVNIAVEEMLRTHFAIFGFTGAGKSNLLSTLIHKTLEAYQNLSASDGNRSETVKIVVFDLMGEYATLLVDWLAKLPNACLVALTEKTLPESVLQYMENPDDNNAFKEAVRVFTFTTLYPKALMAQRTDFRHAWAKLLRAQPPRIRVYKREIHSLGGLIRSLWNPRNLGKNSATICQRIEEICNSFSNQGLNNQTINAAIQRITALQSETENDGRSFLLSTAGAKESVQELLDGLERKAEQVLLSHSLEDSFLLRWDNLISDLNDERHCSLYVFQSHDPDRLREFAEELGNEMFERRRRSGRITPIVAFIMDEADEFIPQRLEGSYAKSCQIAMTLARRGRKFGLCLGIATQRVRYLNTSIMAQPHTYFVSKMPRKSDREAVAEAFGVSEEMFHQTFKFQRGDWLLMSYDATGLEAVPIPIHCENANERIERYLDGLKKAYQQRSSSHVRTP